MASWCRSSLPLVLTLPLFGCMADLGVPDTTPPVVRLEGNLEVLRQAFNQNVHAPRLVALIPPSCAEMRLALREAQREVEDLEYGSEIQWFVIWQEELPGDDFHAARQACREVAEMNALFYHDSEWLATRNLAYGTVLSGQLKRAFLFYPPGVLWGERPPEPSAWVHDMGRIDRQNVGDPERLTDALRWQWNVLAQPR